MNSIDIEKCLQSMAVIVDSNEQPTSEAQARYKLFDVPYRIQKIDYGDYTFNFTLPDGSELHSSDDHRIYPDTVVIERKASLTELSGNLCQAKKRFEAEFKRATDKGCHIYLLVEGASWEAIYSGRYGTKFHPNAYSSALYAMLARYRIQLIFCRKEQSGRIIHDILYRELKERLESGFYG